MPSNGRGAGNGVGSFDFVRLALLSAQDDSSEEGRRARGF